MNKDIQVKPYGLVADMSLTYQDLLKRRKAVEEIVKSHRGRGWRALPKQTLVYGSPIDMSKKTSKATPMTVVVDLKPNADILDLADISEELSHLFNQEVTVNSSGGISSKVLGGAVEVKEDGRFFFAA
ncbi:hypothetical protein QYQ99_25600 [Comamonas testosteroni]|uniref:hypothetical protein n=1 Tax=Comamonas testosteroni TaxID=285 RepID=UPI00265F1FDA|nr:hypothetical protein [Comamonas testosteroni]WKL15664.1 hypothetical protein QYQ99_25600 [Comamonas testosteroni]